MEHSKNRRYAPKRSFSSSRPNSSRTRAPQGGGRRGGGRGRGPAIDIVSFIKRSTETKHTEKKIAPVTSTFSDFAISENLKVNLAKRGYTIPTPIQDQAIPALLAGRDVIGLASTGTGKTGAFLLPLITKIEKDKNQKVLIMAPTRELALQIEQEFRLFSTGMKIYSAFCVGGMPISRQIENLRYRPHVVIGTPGRLKDLADRGCIRYSEYQNVVLDEVDHMLDMGFIDPITKIMNALPANRQTLFFSATMPPRIRTLTSQFLKNPVTIEISSGSTSSNITQEVVRVEGDRTKKFNVLHDMLSTPELTKVLIFSETKRDVERLTIDLRSRGHKAVSIHGDKRQRERARALTDFKTNIATILVATDVAARGIDIKEVSHVINYTIPQTFDDYVHRIGRTGRGSHKGTALTFI